MSAEVGMELWLRARLFRALKAIAKGDDDEVRYEMLQVK